MAPRLRAVTGMSLERCSEILKVLPADAAGAIIEICEKMREQAPAVERTPKRRWLSFTIRDLLWLVLVVAIVLGWWTYSQRVKSCYFVTEEKPNGIRVTVLHDAQNGETWMR